MNYSFLKNTLFLAILCLALSKPLLAHDTWLLARQSILIPPGLMVFDLTSGMSFPKLEYVIKKDRVQQALIRIGGLLTSIEGFNEVAGKSLQFSLLATKQGFAVCCVELKPKELELKADKVREYLAEIGASDSLKALWKRPSAGLRWREQYVKHAKTFVSVGKPEVVSKMDSSWSKPVGMVLEIIPHTNPLLLKAGNTMTVQVFKNGAPLAGFVLGCERENDSKHEVLKTTDAQGKTTFTLSKSGKWLLHGTELRPSSKPNLEYESDFTTLTVEVRP